MQDLYYIEYYCRGEKSEKIFNTTNRLDLGNSYSFYRKRYTGYTKFRLFFFRFTIIATVIIIIITA